MNAFDYWLAGGKLNSFYFHLDIFLWYAVQCVLMFFLFRNLMNRAKPHRWNGYLAIFAVAFYALHTANAETVNYISARSDSFSTLCVIASLLLYQYEKPRKLLLYLVPATIGIWTKQTTVMLVPILFLYTLLFEENMPAGDRMKARRAVARAAGKTIPAFALVVGLFLLNQLVLTPGSTVSHNEDVSNLAYFATQWHVIVHYLKNFILPVSLSADPDFAINVLVDLTRAGLAVRKLRASVANRHKVQRARRQKFTMQP